MLAVECELKVNDLYKECLSAPIVKAKLKPITSVDFELLISNSGSTEERGGEKGNGVVGTNALAFLSELNMRSCAWWHTPS